MRRLFALFALLCACVGLHAQAADSALLKNVLDQLASHPQVRADFEQRRENPALAAPQISRGKLLFVVGQGMLWQTQDPFQETLALTGSRTARVDEQGRLQTVRSGDRGVAQVSQMLQGMLAGKPDEALRQFDVHAEGTPGQWTLRFTPKQARMARVLTSIALEGGPFLDGIDIVLQSGERTQIRFSHTREAGSLSQLEQRALGSP
ncbi:MAG TPA: outer membrane lipoprotein carrier protein LolA [Dyella sp.]|uniref:LolA family protein n=1 Tax=Dyella sp. TaxID=1869338 RepID=UPI002F94F340